MNKLIVSGLVLTGALLTSCEQPNRYAGMRRTYSLPATGTSSVSIDKQRLMQFCMRIGNDVRNGVYQTPLDYANANRVFAYSSVLTYLAMDGYSTAELKTYIIEMKKLLQVSCGLLSDYAPADVQRSLASIESRYAADLRYLESITGTIVRRGCLQRNDPELSRLVYECSNLAK